MSDRWRMCELYFSARLLLTHFPIESTTSNRAASFFLPPTPLCVHLMESLPSMQAPKSSSPGEEGVRHKREVIFSGR